MAYRAAYTRLAAGTGRAATRRDHDYQPAFTGAAGR
jgi:hypothetical protein